MLPVIQIGPVTLRTPGLALLAGLWIGLEIASREASRLGIDENKAYNLGFGTLVAGVLGARLGFVLMHLDLYTSITPWTRAVTSVLALAPGTEDPWFGLLATALFVVILVHQWQIDPLLLADAFAPALAVFAIAIGLANVLSGEYYGIETSLPWGIQLWGAKRHPAQVYFMLANSASLVLLLRLRGPDASWSKRKHRPKKPETSGQPGLVGQIFLILLSLSILLIEPLRADSPATAGGIRIWQVIALIVLVGTLATFIYRPPILPARSP